MRYRRLGSPLVLGSVAAAVIVALWYWKGPKKDIPENAPGNCPGVNSERAGADNACEGCPNRSICTSGAAVSVSKDIKSVAEHLADVKHVILVLSGKGGVGKSTIASQLAWELESRNFTVGLLDVDICGPSIPRMTGTKGAIVKSYSDGWLPVMKSDNLLIMSIGYLIPTDDGAVIWRGPKKNGLIKQFLTDVYWGALDYLIVDTPPGTTDEHLSIITYLSQIGIDGAVIITMPQEVSLQDVRKEINFCRETKTKVIGVVENMTNSVFSRDEPDATRKMCTQMNVPYAGQIELDAELVRASEQGRPVNRLSPAYAQILKVLDRCLVNLN